MPVQRTTLFDSIERLPGPVRLARLSLPILASALILAGIVRLPSGASFAVAQQSVAVASSAEASPTATGSEDDVPAVSGQPLDESSEQTAQSSAPVTPSAEASRVEYDDTAELKRLLRMALERSQQRDPAAAKLATPHQIAAAGTGSALRRQLSQEQMNVARFISGRYRVAADSTGEFVYHAYRAARETKVDPFLILAVMAIESSFNPLAQSGKGAQGLMQVMTRVHAERFVPFGGVTAAFDPVANIRVGSKILKEYLDREGTVEGALKSYVGAALLSHDNGYGAKVLSERARIAAAAAGRPSHGAAAAPLREMTGLDPDRSAESTDRAASKL